MESIAVWQGATLGGIVAWILISSYLNVTPNLSCNLGWLTMSSLGLLSSSRSRFYSTFATINENPDHHSCSIVSIYMFFCFSLDLNFFFLGFFFFFFFRNTSIGFLMLCSLDCPVLFLCPFTLPFSLCYSGYVLSLYNVDNGL